MELEFKPGDRVMLTRVGSALYGGAWPHFIPEGQGGGNGGTVLHAEFRGENKPGAAPRPYMVKWDNGVSNSYRIEDLESEADALMRLANLRTTPAPDAKIVMFSNPTR